jgi:protocatechuate 3,4-dioxygenase, beta subunit
MLLTRRAAVAQIAVGSAFAGTALSAQPSTLAPTPEQNVGPFYPMRRPADSDADLTMIRGRRGRATGEVIEVTGRVLNVLGATVAGVSLELWQANAVGRYAHPGDTNEAAPLDPNFQGFARLTTDRQGRYRFVTIKPGAYPIGGGQSRTRHIHVDAAGRTNRLMTQMYFPGDPLNGSDMLLRELNPAQAAAVTARADGVTADGRPRLVWDIVLQAG